MKKMNTKEEKLNELKDALKTTKKAKNIQGIKYFINVPSYENLSKEINTEEAENIYKEIKEIAEKWGFYRDPEFIDLDALDLF